MSAATLGCGGLWFCLLSVSPVQKADNDVTSLSCGPSQLQSFSAATLLGCNPSQLRPLSTVAAQLKDFNCKDEMVYGATFYVLHYILLD
jgi:hypothetical protein